MLIGRCLPIIIETNARLFLVWFEREPKVAVPFREKMFFDEAHRFWDSADNIIDHRYDFRPHLFTLRDSVPVARALQAR